MNLRIIAACAAVEDACKQLAATVSDLRNALSDAWPNETKVTELIDHNCQWSVRAWKCLLKMGVHTWGDLASLTEVDLLREKNFGATSLREVKRKLADQNMHLGMMPPKSPTVPDTEPA